MQNEIASLEEQLATTGFEMKKYLKELGIDRNSPEQKAWEAYRDAQLKAIYPPTDNDIAEYGSAYPMCLATVKKRLTEIYRHSLSFPASVRAPQMMAGPLPGKVRMTLMDLPAKGSTFSVC